jgi:alpha-1,6-mannosyltransferase
LKKLLVTLGPDIIEVSDRFTLSSIGIWAEKRQIPAVVFSHETLSGLVKTYLPFSIQKLVNWHNRRLASRFKYVVTTTEFAAKEFKQIDARNIVRIPLGVDLQHFHPNKRDYDLRESMLKGADVLLLHCGRMSPEKKPELSIHTLRELRSRGINAHLIYVGNGPMYSKLRKISADLPVTFLGYIANREKLAEILASADISIAPGPIETFCLAALESIASGTPVVASNTSAVGEFLLLNSREQVGTVANGNPVDFANAVQQMLQIRNADTSLSMRAHQQAENYPWSSTVAMLLNLHGEKEEIRKSKHRLRAA